MRIGLLLDTLMNGYQQELLLGAHDECARQGVDLYCLVGGTMSSQDQTGLMYDLVTSKHFDGLSIISGTIIHSQADALLPYFLGKFPGIPKVSIAGTCGDVPTIEVDNGTGIRDSVLHLAKVHGRKRIACLRVDSPEGSVRFKGYQEGLAAAGLPFLPELVVNGDFTYASGEAAARELCIDRKATFDAMMSCSDWMAIGFMEGLRKLGKQIPRDVALAGFDDIEDARFCSPPLTTVGQPIRQLGVFSVRQVMSQLRGEPQLGTRLLATRFHPRQSCGCGMAAGTEFRLENTPGVRGIWTLIRSRGVLAEAVKRSCPDFEVEDASPWPESLVDALLADLQDRSLHLFQDALASVLKRVEYMGSLTTWHRLIVELRSACLPTLIQDAEEALHACTIFEQAHILISQSAERLQGRKRLAKNQQLATVSAIGRSLKACFQSHSVNREIIGQLSQMEIRGFQVVLHDTECSPEGQSCLLFSFDDTRSIQPWPREVRFQSGEIVPKSHAPYRRHTMIVLPLRFGMERIGLCAIEMGPKDVSLYESLREQIRSVLECADSHGALFPSPGD